MFDQNPATSPGIGSVTEHGGEMLIMLLVMLLLGMALSWLLTRNSIRQLRLVSAELARTREQLAAAERRAQPQARLRQASPSDHEQVLKELRSTKMELAAAQARIRELETTPATAAAPLDPVEAVLPFIEPAKRR
jgi:septal ring factor EnvC (AmiA/AmiB activator)